MLDDDSEDGHGHLGCSGVVRVLEEVPEVSLGGGAGARPEVLLLLLPVLRVRQQPPGSVVGVLAAGLQVQVIQAPVL